MDTRTHNLVGQAATGRCASRLSRQSVPAARVWSFGYVVPTAATKPVITMSADHANLETRRLKEPSP